MMIYSSFRYSARVGCRRAMCPAALTTVGCRQQQPPGGSRTSAAFSNGPAAQRRTLSGSVRDIGMGSSPSFMSKHPGCGSSNHSIHRGVEKDTPPPPPITAPPAATAAVASKAPTLADRWKAARSKVTAEYLKHFMKRYGRVAATFHMSVFLGTLGTCYSLIDYGGLDIAELVKDVPILADNLPPAGAGNLAIAYGMTSAIGPPRAVLTVTVTPRIARFLAGREEERRREDEGGTTPP
ncbi:conserved unknown protein [Ectocarpus siliculosus]|uniref:DUF1279 domain-containing protein n=1 Tax=Ectocarpus siliculosus TaxID=2880 RepID=D8LFS1_ECTSI|nr:conserved unknown protein [Ectocarpus siliculosus]|eukprot:CBN75645.1 conserved unknown protein [Ectocarpus siliculosus]